MFGFLNGMLVSSQLTSWTDAVSFQSSVFQMLYIKQNILGFPSTTIVTDIKMQQCRPATLSLPLCCVAANISIAVDASATSSHNCALYTIVNSIFNKAAWQQSHLDLHLSLNVPFCSHTCSACEPFIVPLFTGLPAITV